MLDDLDPQACTNARLRQLTRMVTSHYDHHFKVTGIRNTQLALLSHVIALGPVRPGILAKRMQMDASTLTRNLQPLVAKDWLVMAQGTLLAGRRLQCADGDVHVVHSMTRTVQ